MINIRCAVTILLVALIGSPVSAQRNLTDIPDPDPQKELERLRVADGFEINLFASDPVIAKPIQSNWDARGRLWVATSSVYPQLEPGEVANDKIVILEDTDGDGKADKNIVFAEGLLIPTGVLPAGNGAYVANSTELLFMEDTDSDDKADKTHVILSGFGTEDTHHILHTLRRGPGGFIYFNQSIYIHSNIETPWGPKRLDGGGIWKFRPESLELDVWVRGFVNPWGHQFDDWGQQFATDGAFGEGVNFVFPGSAFVTAVGADRILQGLSPGQPKHASLAILSGEHLPEDYRGTFIANDFRGNRVNRFEIEESQSGYVARQVNDLVWTDHVAFRPVDVSMGPDGAIYVSDWYNPIIQHGEVDFRDPRRDRIHGRIWRVTAKDRPLVKRPELTDATPQELVQALTSPQRWTRDAARQLIAERGRDEMIPALTQFLNSLSKDAPEFERNRLEVLWAQQSLGAVDLELLKAVLHSSEHRARAAAVRVLSDEVAKFSEARVWLAAAATDAHPQVRLEAVNGLRQLGDAEAAKQALAALEAPLDKNLDYALWLTARELQERWLPKVSNDPNFLGPVSRLVFALNAAATAEAVTPAVKLWDEDDVSKEERSELAALIGRFGGPREVARLAEIDILADGDLRTVALSALLVAAKNRKVVPKNAANVLRFIDSDSDEAAAIAAELTGLYRIEGGVAQLTEIATGEGTPKGVRAAAISGLAADGGPEAKAALAKLASLPNSPATRVDAVSAWSRVDLQAAASAAGELLQDSPTEAETAALITAFLTAQDGAKTLALSLKGKKVTEPVASAALRAVSTSAIKAEPLAEALRVAGGLAELNEEMTPQQIASLVEQVQASGDPQRGELLYRRDDLQCLKCHAIGGAGGIVGPDLTSIGGSAQIDYLIESLLQPSSKIKEGYHTTTVVRDDGTISSGVLVRKTGEAIVLRDNNGQEVSIPSDDVVEEVISPVSLMPTGLTQKLRRDELVDLVAFLSRLGKPGDYQVKPGRFVRSWRVLDASPQVGALVRANGTGALARAPQNFPWRSVVATVSGSLLLSEVPAADFFNGQKFRVVQFAVATPEAGRISMKLPSATGIAAYLAGSPLEVVEETTLDLPAGQSVITLVLEVGKFPKESLEIEISEAEGSSARAQLVNQF